MSNIVMLSNVRLSFPHLAEPQKNTMPDGNVRISYSGDFILGPDHQGFKDFMEAVGAIAAEKWGEKANNVLHMVQNDRKLRCFGKGDEKINQKTFQPYDGYAGMLYITAGKSTPPQIIQDNGKAVDSGNTMAYQQLTRKMYGGCRVNVALKPWAQDNKHGKAIRCELVAVQFFADDGAFGGGETDASDMFDAVKKEEKTEAPAADMGLPPFMQ